MPANRGSGAFTAISAACAVAATPESAIVATDPYRMLFTRVMDASLVWCEGLNRTRILLGTGRGTELIGPSCRQIERVVIPIPALSPLDGAIVGTCCKNITKADRLGRPPGLLRA